MILRTHLPTTPALPLNLTGTAQEGTQELPPVHQARLLELLTFIAPPTDEVIVSRCRLIAALVNTWDNERNKITGEALIDVPSWMAKPLQLCLNLLAIRVVYVFRPGLQVRDGE